MLNNKTIAVVVPAYNEEKQIGQVIKTMPEFVDRIIIVNDCSKDKTAEIVEEYIHKDKTEALHIPSILNNIQKDKYNMADWVVQEYMKKEMIYFTPSEVVNVKPDNDRILLINLLENTGVGAAIARGYKWAKDHGIDCTAVMAGDGQMDPAELESICKPVVEEGIDYVKGNRLIHKSANIIIPKVRFFGNSVLSILTKFASGYWRVSDTQTGYTAISKGALSAIELHKIYKSYGMPNDMLVRLNIAMCTLKEVEIKPVYEVGEQSKMKIGKLIPRVSWLLLKSFYRRIWRRYFIKDFHPLFVLYNLSFILFVFSVPFAIKILKYLFITAEKTLDKPILNSMMFFFLFISSVQFLLFAMWMDIQDNERLYK